MNLNAVLLAVRLVRQNAVVVLVDLAAVLAICSRLLVLVVASQQRFLSNLAATSRFTAVIAIVASSGNSQL
jgi:hypothetical protein